MKTLYLLRHAKSSWDDPRIADHDRPLAPRGRKAAGRMAAHLSRARPHPDLVLCSSATRARQTYEPIAAAIDASVPVQVEDGLYGAVAADLVTRLNRLPEDVGTVLMIGHNPALQDLAIEIAGDGDPKSLARVRGKFPTGALATLSLGRSWAQLDSGSAYLEAVVVPRELSGR